MAVRKLAGQTLIYGLSSIVARMVSWLLTIPFAHYFGTADYGIFSDLYAWVSYPLIVLTFGMETSFFRFAEKNGDSNQAYVNSFVSVGILTAAFAVLAVGMAPNLAVWLDYPKRTDLMLLLIGITVLDVTAAVPMARLRFREKPKRFAIINITNVALFVSLNILFLFVFKLGIVWVFVANLIASAVKLLMALWDNAPPHLNAEKATLYPMLTYGFVMMITGFSGQLNEMIDKNLLPDLWPAGKVYAGKARSGLEMNGIYNACYKLGMFITLAAQAFRYAAEPFFFRQASDKKAPETFAKVFHYFMLACLVTFLLIAAFAREIVSFPLPFSHRTLLPPDYWLGAGIVPIVLMANIQLAAFTNLSIWYKITEQLRFGFLFSLLGTAITIAVNVVLIPRYGFWAAAWSHLACYGSMAIASYVFGQKYYPVPYRMLRMGAYTFLVLLSFWAAWNLNPGFGFHWGDLLLKVALVLATIAFLLLLERTFPPFQAVVDQGERQPDPVHP